MLTTIQYTIILLAGISFFVGTERLLPILTSNRKAKGRLKYRRERTVLITVEKLLKRWTPLYRHLSDLLTAIDHKISFAFFLFSTVLLSSLSFLFGVTVLNSFEFACFLSIMLGAIPYIGVRWFLINFHGKVHKELLAAVETFIQTYNIIPSRNMRQTLNQTIPQLRYPIRYAFEQLLMMIDSQEEDDVIIRIFKTRLGNLFADEFIIIFFQGLRSGVNMTEYLVELLEDMRNSEQEYHQDRLRNWEIRAGNILNILAFAYFGYKNYTTREDFITFYFRGEGKTLTLITSLALFGTFILGIYISNRRKH